MDRDRAQGPKIKIFKKLKKHPQVITQETSIPNFRTSDNFWDLQAAPKFSVILGPRPSPGPKNQNFQKMKKTPPGIYPRNKFTKFQHNPTIFESSRLPRSFRSILGPILSYWAQKTKFSKNEKNTPRYLPKEQVYQISANSDNLWAFYAAPKFLGTHRHTDRHTDRHCQILAQLKLRIETRLENASLLA